VVSYRPFTKKFGYRNDQIIERQYRNRYLFPSEKPNVVLATISSSGSEFDIFASKYLIDRHFMTEQAFPLYTYLIESSEEGMLALGGDQDSCKEGISNWALDKFRKSYSDKAIEKHDIFNYVYAVLSSPEFKQKFGVDAKKLGPRLPLLKDFWKFAEVGGKLLELHTNYEEIEIKLPLTIDFSNPKKLKDEDTYLVSKMKFTKKYSPDSPSPDLVFNEFITIRDIPKQAFQFKINGRSPLEWVVDQYQVFTDKDTQIIDNPNKHDKDPKFVFHKVLQAIEVSVMTLELYGQLPVFELSN
jgi:predicted helicase